MQLQRSYVDSVALQRLSATLGDGYLGSYCGNVGLLTERYMQKICYAHVHNLCSPGVCIAIIMGRIEGAA